MSQHFIVNGIVAQRDAQPYVQLLTEDHGIIGQFNMAEARNLAHDILTMCARTEADAMIHRFFKRSDFPVEASNALMMDFRNFRHELDREKVETTETDPDTGADIS
jgi:hypothetical protein